MFKISAISLVLRTREITDIFNTLDNTYLVFNSKYPLSIYWSNSSVIFWLTYHISSIIRQIFIFFQNSPRDLDPSYKMDLNLWDCLGRVKLVLRQNFTGLIKLFGVILERENPRLIAG